MRLVCRECSAVYEAPDSLFGPQPREVRCNRCGYQWTVIGASHQGEARPAALVVGPPDPPVATPAESQASEPPRPVAPPPPLSPPPPRVTARREEQVAVRPTVENRLVANTAPRPLAAAEPAGPSTRTLLAGDPGVASGVAMPDPEERRLSLEFDFGAGERRRRMQDQSTRSRRLVLIIVLVVVLAAIAAVVLKVEIVAVFPQLAGAYAMIGL